MEDCCDIQDAGEYFVWKAKTSARKASDDMKFERADDEIVPPLMTPKTVGGWK